MKTTISALTFSPLSITNDDEPVYYIKRVPTLGSYQGTKVISAFPREFVLALVDNLGEVVYELPISEVVAAGIVKAFKDHYKVANIEEVVNE